MLKNNLRRDPSCLVASKPFLSASSLNESMNWLTYRCSDDSGGHDDDGDGGDGGDDVGDLIDFDDD